MHVMKSGKSDKTKHTIHFKTHLHDYYILEESQRNSLLSGIGMKHAFVFHWRPLHQGIVFPLSSPGEKST